MNFRRQKGEEPDINLIPLIDVLLVVLIFLMVTTTYSKFSELQITLPTAEAEKTQIKPQELNVAIDSQGRYAINGRVQAFTGVDNLAQNLLAQVDRNNKQQPIVIISADAQASHQSVINVMEAARIAQLVRLSFAAQSGAPNSVTSPAGTVSDNTSVPASAAAPTPAPAFAPTAPTALTVPAEASNKP